jgi:hypothetical protein
LFFSFDKTQAIGKKKGRKKVVMYKTWADCSSLWHKQSYIAIHYIATPNSCIYTGCGGHDKFRFVVGKPSRRILCVLLANVGVTCSVGSEKEKKKTDLYDILVRFFLG